MGLTQACGLLGVSRLAGRPALVGAFVRFVIQAKAGNELEMKRLGVEAVSTILADQGWPQQDALEHQEKLERLIDQVWAILEIVPEPTN